MAENPKLDLWCHSQIFTTFHNCAECNMRSILQSDDIRWILDFQLQWRWNKSLKSHVETCPNSSSGLFWIPEERPVIFWEARQIQAAWRCVKYREVISEADHSWPGCWMLLMVVLCCSAIFYYALFPLYGRKHWQTLHFHPVEHVDDEFLERSEPFVTP